MSRDLTNYSPNSVWDFMSEMERAFDDIWKAPQSGSGTRSSLMQNFHPAVDVHETQDNYLISVDVPGVPEKDIKINIQDGRLSVSGERSSKETSGDKWFKRTERSYGRFERSFQLPKGISEDKIQARAENGVLEILIPKAEVAKPRSISVEAGKGGGLFSKLVGGEKKTESKENH